MTSTVVRDWSPFRLADPGAHAEAPRSIHNKEGVGDRLELVFGVRCRVHVRVQFAGELAVCLFDRVLAGVARDTQNLVVVH